jgi:hypothetical protein
MKGSISEFELGVLRARMLDAARAKARRGELRISVPIGYVWHRHFPRPSDGKRLVVSEWTPIRYRNVISVLKNPFYGGAYAYGKGEKRTEIVDERARKSYGHPKPLEQWEVLLKDHHDGYIDWAEFERNQEQLAVNAFGKAGGVKSGCGERALLAGLLSCGLCGRHVMVSYSDRRAGSARIPL